MTADVATNGKRRGAGDSEVILACTGLRKSFTDGDLHVDALKGVDLEVRAGSCIGIIGSSGSGKSTLLHLLGGLDVPSAGVVTVAGQSLTDLPAAAVDRLRNRQLGFVYQFHHLLPEFSVLENVAMPLLIRGMTASRAQALAGEALAELGLTERRRHRPAELSGGERQRTAIARALVTRPQCILADEPTGNLDERTAEQVFNVMLELNKSHGISLALVTHNLRLLRDLDQVYELHDGRLHPRQPA